MTKIDEIINQYREMSDDQLAEELDALFDLIEAMLIVSESKSIETYPTPEKTIRFEIVEKKVDHKYLC